MSSTPASSPPRERVPPAVRNGILRADQLPPVQDLPDDPATREARHGDLAALLRQWAENPDPDEPDWDVAELFPPGRPR
ncbi:MAG: hypothetical protein U0324_29315 [Polyangiales bacterium]